ncbi:putative NRPS-like protein biosynthetic cluster, partial [Claviceps citrina]
MAVIKESAAQQPKYMPRLLPAVVDQIAASDPGRPYIYQPRPGSSSQPEWAPISFGQLANAVHHVAHLLSRTVKKGSSERFPTVVYVGHNDVRIGIVVLAAVKAGCQAFFVSPRNTVEGQRSLLERTGCKHVWYAESFFPAVRAWTEGRVTACWQVPPEEEWLRAETPPFPYTKTYDEARFDPLVVLHTSGSTGVPKPIVLRQGGLAVSDDFRVNLAAPFHGGDFFWRHWQAHSTRMLSMMPGFHASGLLANFLIVPIYFDLPIALPPGDQPLTADLSMKCLARSGADSAMMPPSLLEELSMRKDGLDALKKLSFVSFGGGNLATRAGDRLVERGVTPFNDPKNWQYFSLNGEAMGAVWRLHDADEQIYELVIRRKDPRDPLDQPCFYTFPEKTEWPSGDLFKAHPTLRDHWRYQGRADDIIVLSNGEKLNPVTLEDGVMGHSLIKGALVVGQDRFQPALFLEPYTQPATEDEARQLVEQTWPLIDALNKQTVAHGRISRQLVALTDPDAPLPRTPKGTLQRAAANRLYGRRAEELFARAHVVDAAHVHRLDVGSPDSVLRSLLALLADKMKLEHLGADEDFFSAGMDSLQVLHLARLLRAGFEAAGVRVSPAAVAARQVYAHSTPRRLAEHLFAAAATHANGDAGGRDERAEAETWTETEAAAEAAAEADMANWQGLVDKYTHQLPARRGDKPEPLDEGQTVLVTGTTGSLGAYMLHLLCSLASVKSVVALNRGPDGGASRQPGINADRGLTTDFSKVTFLGCDLARPDLGVGDASYRGLLETCDRVIHNAWPVNFNMGVSTFEPHIRGVRHLVDFSSAAAKHVPVVFVSSIGTAQAWPGPGP